MKAVIYARYSSADQREESIEGQLRECQAFAERKGYTIVNTYADRAISGKRADNRPQFQQMIADSKQDEFNFVIVWKIDRFSRDKYESVMYKSMLKKNNIRVLSATEPIDDSPEGKLMESIFERFSEYYLADLSLKTSRGMTDNILKGKYNGGAVTFGYRIDEDRHFQYDPEKAPIVTDIFKRYAKGETIKSIVAGLHEQGIKTLRGAKPSYHFINCMLNNRRYLGEYSFRDTVNENAIPPLVDPQLFEKCQRRLAENMHKPATFKQVEDKYILTGKIFCGECNATMSGVSAVSKSKTIYRYYQCMESKKICRGRCKKKRISKEQIRFWIMKFAKTDISNSEQKQRLIDVFVNGIYVYDDKIVIVFNYKDGEQVLMFDEVNADIKNKENTHISECSSLIKSTDP